MMAWMILLLVLQLMFRFSFQQTTVMIGGQSLSFSTETLSWKDAKSKCASHNARLAVLADPEAFQEYAVANYPSEQHFWIGATKSEGTWTWIDGQPLQNFPWPSGEPSGTHPNGQRENCLEWGHHYKWFNDQICTTAFRYVCEHLECPNGFVQNNGDCFHFSSDSANWNQARKNCQALGKNAGRTADLAELGSSAQWLMDQITAKGKRVWLGASDYRHNRNFVWSHSRRSLSLSHSFWHPDEPNNEGGDEFCLDTLPNDSRMELNDVNCDNGKPYVCQIF